ncbi:L-rhamnono-1,4-lactonase [Geosmithia morbida]|uniref:L-rhamnono-1,4-lactonase n=1 Tax=Geosmithia morbida TaxID=1094350 RepID=A0A9P5D2S3_9HYPO|nr:L-rhamnono-1,4-lactonase [Geosmithia morbida]KAF4121100.1 L-rhamnono-1,4-lactonase [Geosmithia morbida]
MSDQEGQVILPIIDSHIHLWPSNSLSEYGWRDGSDPDAPGEHYIQEFREATHSAPSLLGYVLVESDRRFDLESGAADGSGWELPLREVGMMRRAALGDYSDGSSPGGDQNREDGSEGRKDPECLGLVPWAPLPSGPAVMERYIDRVREVAGEEAWPKVKGFRYLVQDKPAGTMLEPGFIESLRLLGRRRFVFEVGVDHHRRGKRQLEEMVSMIEKAHDGVPEEDKVTLIINHLCKPDLTIYNITSDPSFHAWRTTIYTLGKCSNTYMKLSGAFSEMPVSLRTQTPLHIFQSTLGWLGIVLATFGPDRIMFGSDWPVCTLGGIAAAAVKAEEGQDEETGKKVVGAGNGSTADPDAWGRWRDVVEKMCWMGSMTDEERAMVFGGTAKKAYRL